jgi:hypothetical protein
MSEDAQYARHNAMLANGDIEPGREHSQNEYISPGEMAYYESVAQEQSRIMSSPYEGEPSYGDGPYDHLDHEPEGDDYMPDELYTDDGEIIDAGPPKSINEQLLDDLGKRFDRAAVKQRAGYGGKMLDYLATDTVIRRLNQTAQSWSFEIQSLEFRDNLCIVVGRLTIPGLGTRSGIGVQQLMQGGGSEDLVKGASSDALKKAATLYGVGLELYGPDLEAMAAQSPQNAPQPAPQQNYRPAPINVVSPPQNAPQLPPKPANYDPTPSTAQIGKLRYLGQQMNISDEEMSTIAAGMGFELMAMTKRQCSQLIDQLIQRQQSESQPSF